MNAETARRKVWRFLERKGILPASSTTHEGTDELILRFGTHKQACEARKALIAARIAAEVTGDCDVTVYTEAKDEHQKWHGKSLAA